MSNSATVNSSVSLQGNCKISGNAKISSTVTVSGGTLTMGTNDSSVNISNPTVKSVSVNSGTFNYWDGRVDSLSGSGSCNYPKGYQYDQEKHYLTVIPPPPPPEPEPEPETGGKTEGNTGKK